MSLLVSILTGSRDSFQGGFGKWTYNMNLAKSEISELLPKMSTNGGIIRSVTGPMRAHLGLLPMESSDISTPPG